MLKLENIEFIQTLITYLIAYFPTVAFTGFLETLLVHESGDSTAEDLGFLTLNPFVHMDFLGIIFLALPPHFGFGTRIPVNVHNIKKPYENFKLLIVFFAKAFAHLILLFLSVLVFMLLSNKYSEKVNLFVQGDLPHTFLFAILMVLSALINLNIISVVIYSIIGVLRFFAHFFIPDIEEQTGFMSFLIFLFPFLLILVLGPYVEYYLRILLIYVNQLFRILFL